MENQEQVKKSIFTKLVNIYRSATLVLFNTLIFLFIINFLLFIIFKLNDSFSQNVVFNKYNKLNIDLLYQDMERSEIDNLLKETWSRSCIYEPFTQFKERPYRGQYVNVDKNGFRYSKNQGIWPPQSKNFNIFLFGGSTTFGYGVSDNQTIASYLQEYLKKNMGNNICVYNFGRGYYYLTQERILYEQLLTSGFVPDLAIFIDGLNDLAFNNNEPYFTDRLRQLFTAGTVEMLIKLISMSPLGQAAEIVQNKISSLFSKKEIKQLKDLKSRDIENKTLGNSMTCDQVINRYVTDKKFIEAASDVFGVKTVFVWQPVPEYNYDKSYYAFSDGNNGENNFIKNGYLRMFNFIKENPMRSNFIWCADIQKELKQPLYVDRVHYSAGFSKIIAEVIANQLVEKFNLKKKPDHLIVDHN